jgi:hypothetical protein
MKTLRVVWAVLIVLASGQARCEDTETIQARWQAREIQATFSGLHTAYNCDAIEHRLKQLLVALGAHRKTSVLVTGCALEKIASTFFIHIATATSVPLNEGNRSDAREELLRRLGSKNAYGAAEFPAHWKTVDLTKIKQLHFEPGDCELLELIQDQILPKLGAEVAATRLHCTPGSPLTKLAPLNVTMLVPAPAPDAKAP